MTTAPRTIICPVRDLAAAKAVYNALLGTTPYIDEPYYVGFRVGEQELGLDPRGHSQGMTGPVCYWHVPDIERSVAQLLEAGAVAQHPIRDVGGGKRIATLLDADGNVIGLQQPA